MIVPEQPIAFESSWQASKSGGCCRFFPSPACWTLDSMEHRAARRACLVSTLGKGCTLHAPTLRGARSDACTLRRSDAVPTQATASSRRSGKGARSTLRRCVEHAPTRARSDAPTLFRAPSPSLLRPGDGAGAGTHGADPGRCLVSTLGKGCTRSDAVAARGPDGMERCAPRLDSYACLINRVRYKSKFVSNASTLLVRDDPGQPGAALRQLRATGRGATAPAVD
jgi:hypothetical protein